MRKINIKLSDIVEKTNLKSFSCQIIWKLGMKTWYVSCINHVFLYKSCILV
ncbi:hypothetical protein Hanom_Chr12g01114581 [Helianthus anomalus]